MSLHKDLLDLAAYLVRHEHGRPRQATLRRAVSTAYYALFHLLLHEASHAVARRPFTSMVARAFKHSDMKEASKAFGSGGLPPHLRSALAGKPVPRGIRSIANAFVELQQARHEADYDTARTFSRREVSTLIAKVKSAFRTWPKVKGNPAAEAYLLSLLLGKQWRHAK